MSQGVKAYTPLVYASSSSDILVLVQYWVHVQGEASIPGLLRLQGQYGFKNAIFLFHQYYEDCEKH